MKPNPKVEGDPTVLLESLAFIYSNPENPMRVRATALRGIMRFKGEPIPEHIVAHIEKSDADGLAAVKRALQRNKEQYEAKHENKS